MVSNIRQTQPIVAIRSGEDYIESLRGRDLNVYLMGERIDEPVDHPVLRPSVNAVARTYDLALEDPTLASAMSPMTGERVNRFAHVATSAEDLVQQNRMQRRLGQLTGTCFQRCVGMDAINALHSVTYDIDAAHGTTYHARFLNFVEMVQARGYVVGGAMTDVKGDRSKPPHAQDDPDLYVHISQRSDAGIWLTGAKAHQTGCLNSHWLLVMPTLRLGEKDADYAVVAALPVDAPGLTYIVGRQPSDTRALEAGDIDSGNATFGGQEAMIIFDEVFVPWSDVFMHGEYEFAGTLVERFTGFHRRSYVCKSGVGDVLIGAAATIAEYNGVENASHVRDKMVEMTHLNETIYSTGIAASFHAEPLASGVWQANDMLANVCKHHVTKMPYELGRLAQDLAGGLVVTAPSEADLKHAEIGPLVDKYLQGRSDVSTEARLRILRLIENMTLGRNAVGYLTESMHGAGSPEAQRIQIRRQMQVDFKKELAQSLAGINEDCSAQTIADLSDYMARVFNPTD
ncbi:MAG: 4-hydroxyphenylacetate 3-hydroxylase N-terminal domain-containing protein [Pseudomonadota bacterium]